MNNCPKRKIKGSDIYLLVMFSGWIGYIIGSAMLYHIDQVWFPLEITIGTVLLFLYETFALYKLAITREGVDTRGKLDKAMNTVKSFVSSKFNIAEPLDLEEEIQEEIYEQTNES